MEGPEGYEKRIEQESPIREPVTAAEEYPLVTDTVTTTTVTHHEMESPEKYQDIEGESGEMIGSSAFYEGAPREEKIPLEEGVVEPSFGDKLAGFAGKAAKIAGGVVVAPVALAAMGAAAAYEAVTKKEDQPLDAVSGELFTHGEKASGEDVKGAETEEALLVAQKEYDTESQKQPLSSPTTTEGAPFEEKPEGYSETLSMEKPSYVTYEHEEATAPGVKDEEQYVIESSEYDTESQKQPLSSPTTTEGAPFEEKPEGYSETLSMEKPSYVTYEHEEATAPGVKDEEQYVIESSEYDTESQKQPLSSPTTTEGAPFEEKPEGYSETLSMEKPSYVTYEHEEATAPGVKDEEQYVIESSEYDTESQKATAVVTNNNRRSSVRRKARRLQ
ncbi:hypothetical protein COOONC_08750 [Cooperia oncophora]